MHNIQFFFSRIIDTWIEIHLFDNFELKHPSLDKIQAHDEYKYNV